MIADRVADELRNGVTMQFPQNVRPVGFYRLDAQVQHRSHFTAVFALRQKLHDLSFPSRYPQRFVLTSLSPFSQISGHHHLAHFGRKERLVHQE